MSTFDDEKRMQPFLDEWYRSKGVTKIDRSQLCRRFDAIISIDDKEYCIEEKYLLTEPFERCLIEIIQDIETADLGWFYHVDCHSLVWVYCGRDNGRDGAKPTPPIEIHSIGWKKLKRYILEKMKTETWASFNICAKNYGTTLNYPVGWFELHENNISTTYKWNPPK